MASVLERTCLFRNEEVRAHVVVIVLLLGLCVTLAHLNMASKSVLPTKAQSLKGREEKVVVAGKSCLS